MESVFKALSVTKYGMVNTCVSLFLQWTVYMYIVLTDSDVLVDPGVDFFLWQAGGDFCGGLFHRLWLFVRQKQHHQGFDPILTVAFKIEYMHNISWHFYFMTHIFSKIFFLKYTYKKDFPFYFTWKPIWKNMEKSCQIIGPCQYYKININLNYN